MSGRTLGSVRARASWRSAWTACRGERVFGHTIWRVALALELMGSVAGCPRPRPPAVLSDAGPETDAPFIMTGADTDLDGLCDTTEASLGLSPLLSDTDSDGYSDMIEYANGSDGRMLDSPDRSTIVFLSEAPGARIDASISYSVRGEGESYVGSFNDVRGLLADPDLRASDYLVGVRAVGALPPENVILVEGERFVGARGRTLLFYEMTFQNASVPEGCLRAFSFQYVMKDESDGRIIGIRRGLLVVAPPGLSPAVGARWCPLRDTCF